MKTYELDDSSEKVTLIPETSLDCRRRSGLDGFFCRSACWTKSYTCRGSFCSYLSWFVCFCGVAFFVASYWLVYSPGPYSSAFFAKSKQTYASRADLDFLWLKNRGLHQGSSKEPLISSSDDRSSDSSDYNYDVPTGSDYDIAQQKFGLQYQTLTPDTMLLQPSSTPAISRQQAISYAEALHHSDLSTKHLTNYDHQEYVSWDDVMSNDPSCRFDIYGNDVMVFFHVQKTGGTMFERFLTRHLHLERPCACTQGRKRCDCYRPRKRPLTALDDQNLPPILQEWQAQNGFQPQMPQSQNNQKELWLFSRFSTGWSCGIHADWTEMFASRCVDNAMDRIERRKVKRRYFIATVLREPVARFVSEYRHVRRGATWPSLHRCGGRPATPRELPSCFHPQEGWDGVTLDEFLDCPYNLAFNRQTRMLADLTLVGCYSRPDNMSQAEWDAILLASAQRNLQSMAYFGLLERLSESQAMFERTFNLTFTGAMDTLHVRSKSNGTQVTEQQKQRILAKNHLDLKLYKFAVDLFSSRWHQMSTTAKPFM